MKTETTEWSRAMLLLAALLATSGAHAKAYKCVVAGKTTFQDQPCIEEKVIAPTPAKPQEGGATLGSDAFFNAADKPPYHPATVADLATATPRDFLMRSLKACEDKNEGKQDSGHGDSLAEPGDHGNTQRARSRVNAGPSSALPCTGKAPATARVAGAGYIRRRRCSRSCPGR